MSMIMKQVLCKKIHINGCKREIMDVVKCFYEEIFVWISFKIVCKESSVSMLCNDQR